MILVTGSILTDEQEKLTNFTLYKISDVMFWYTAVVYNII
jgi:hypothetical protein